MNKKSVPILAAALSLAWLVSAPPAEAKSKPKEVSPEVSDALHAVSVRSKLIDKLGADALRITSPSPERRRP